MPFHSRPFGPCFSHADSPGQSANATMQPLHVFGCPVTDRPCGKVSALGLGPDFRAGGAATIATSATQGAMFGEWGVATLATTATRGLRRGLVSRLSRKSQGGALRFPPALRERQTTSATAFTMRHTSLRAAQRTTVPGSSATIQPWL